MFVRNVAAHDSVLWFRVETQTVVQCDRKNTFARKLFGSVFCLFRVVPRGPPRRFVPGAQNVFATALVTIFQWPNSMYKETKLEKFSACRKI